MELSPAGRELVTLALRMTDTIDLELAPLTRELHAFARRQPGCRALIERLYGVGPVSATAILAELGDCRRVEQLARGAALVVGVVGRRAGVDPAAPSFLGQRAVEPGDRAVQLEVADRPRELVGPEEHVADAAGEAVGDANASLSDGLLDDAVVVELEQVRLAERAAAV